MKFDILTTCRVIFILSIPFATLYYDWQYFKALIIVLTSCAIYDLSDWFRCPAREIEEFYAQEKPEEVFFCSFFSSLTKCSPQFVRFQLRRNWNDVQLLNSSDSRNYLLEEKQEKLFLNEQSVAWWKCSVFQKEKIFRSPANPILKVRESSIERFGPHSIQRIVLSKSLGKFHFWTQMFCFPTKKIADEKLPKITVSQEKNLFQNSIWDFCYSTCDSKYIFKKYPPPKKSIFWGGIFFG